MQENSLIYLDYNATTPVAPEAARALGSYLEAEFGNPSSDYALGRRAKDAVARARGQVAALIRALPEEIVFTGGATEANNLVLQGVARHFGKGQIITAATEHPSVLAPCWFLASQGFELTVLPVDEAGLLSPEDVRRALKRDTILISVMHANNETGTIQPLAAIGALARDAGVLFHTDAAQSTGKIPVAVADLGVDFLTVAGHKLYAPKGVGALYVRQGRPLVPLLHGAGQEGGRRAGTENVPYLVALGEACRLAGERLDRDQDRLRSLRDLLHRLLLAGFPGLVLNGHDQARLPNTLNVSFPGLSGADILAGVPRVAASLGAACHAGGETISPVLAAMGVPPEVARGAVRLSLGRPTTREQVEQAADLLLARVKELSK